MPRPPGYLLAPVDKGHALPAGYRPRDLVPYPRGGEGRPLRVRRLIAPHLDALLAACAEAGGEAPMAVSAYRSYAYQARLFAANCAAEAQRGLPATRAEERANTYSARPGHSEHQLGTTVDLSVAALGYELMESFGSTTEGLWLRDNAHRHGFVLSYPPGKTPLTGYIYEPWHVRWVGQALATRLYEAGYLDPGTTVTLGGWLAAGVPDRGPVSASL